MIKRLILNLIKIYQLFISPLLGRNCRFYPTCSEYSLKSIEKYGLLKGGTMSFSRLLKCHPWHPGGVDLPEIKNQNI